MVPVLEKIIAHQTGIFTIPFPPIIQCDKTEELKLSNCHISHSSSLSSLFSLDTDPYVCGQDHIHIICSIANCKGLIWGSIFHITYDILFLNWCASIANRLMVQEIIRHRLDLFWSIDQINLFILIVTNFFTILLGIRNDSGSTVNQPTWSPNIYSSLFFVSCQNKKLYSCTFHPGDRLLNIILKAILNCSSS